MKLENTILSELTSHKKNSHGRKEELNTHSTTHRQYKTQEEDHTKVWILQSYSVEGRESSLDNFQELVLSFHPGIQG